MDATIIQIVVGYVVIAILCAFYMAFLIDEDRDRD